MICKIRRSFISPDRPEIWNAIRCLSYFSADTGAVLVLILLMCFSTLAGILQAWPLAILIDSVAAPTTSRGWIHRLFSNWLPPTGLTLMIGLAATALVLCVTQQLLSTLQKLLHARINYGGVLRMREDLFRWLQLMHVDFHRTRPLGDTVFRLTTDTFGCQAVLGVIIGVAFAILRIVVILALLLPRSLALTAIALLVVPPLVWANLRFGKSLKLRTVAAKEADSAFLSFSHRTMAVVGLTQAYTREEDEYRRFGSAARGCVNSWFGINKEETGYNFCVGAILGLGGALILGYGGYLVQQDSLTPGDLMIFMAYLGMMYDPLCQLTGAGMNLQSGLASAKRVFEVLDREPEVSDNEPAAPLGIAPRRLTLENVGFRYGDGLPVLRDVSINIEPGQVIGFVGTSGVGKSTLLSLLPRFYDPTDGRILLDGQDIREIRIRDLRKHIALALQDPVILPTDIRENLAYGRPSASEAEIWAAAERAGVTEFIEQLSAGYATRLTEGGANLSGGQRQRIAIARALLTEAPILVLDEPTSAQDAYHEDKLRQTVAQLKGRCTVIIVSHRIHMLKDCDRICVLAGGTIKESGSHDELLAASGIYARLARHADPTLSNAA